MATTYDRGVAVEPGATRELFGELVCEARSELGQKPSEMATRYLVDLLDNRVRTPAADPEEPGTLAEALLGALGLDGVTARVRLRALGDRVLFDAGFFGESLSGRAVGVEYYSDIGRTAYARLSRSLVDGGAERRSSASALFRELAFHFSDFVELLAEVGARSRGRGEVDLLRLYETYQETGSARARARLLRHGLIPPSESAGRRRQ